MGGHTKGPWVVVNDCGIRGEGRSIAIASPNPRANDGSMVANARLIAAAPDMLEALRMLVADFGDYPASERPCLAFDKARSAIAKATGQEGGAL